MSAGAGLRGATMVALGACAYAAAWGFGSRPLAVVGLGLALAGAAALVWRRLAPAALALTTRLHPVRAEEGRNVRIDLALERRHTYVPASTALELAWPRVGTRRVELRGRGAHLRGDTVLEGLPRGVHVTTRVTARFEDPLGLEAVTQELAPLPPIVVHPRVVSLETLFAGGLVAGTATRHRRRRAGATDIRSVRPHQPGEALRSVHWPTTARRGALMLRELEEPRSGGLVIVLDCDPVAALGVPPDTPFEAAVRAAGSIAVSVAARGREALLCATSRQGLAIRVGPRTVTDALDALAGVEADAPAPLASALSRPHGPIAGAQELVVVTARADAHAAAALRGRVSAVVWVDAASWAAPRAARRPAARVALAAGGAPVATLRRGDDLARVLGGGAMRRVAP